MQKSEPKIIEKDGLKWYIRPDSKIGNCTQDMLGPNEREQYNFDILMKYAGEKAVFIDVGANVGGFAIRMGEHYGEVIAFEPNEYNFKALGKNMELNSPKTQSVSAWLLAVGDEAKEVEISMRGGGSRISDSATRKNNFKHQKVKCITLDGFRVDKVDIIKIDTEGFEEQVLRGAEKIIKRDKPALLIETHEKTYHGDPLCVGQINRIFKTLEAWGYTVETLFETQYGDKHLYAHVQ